MITLKHIISYADTNTLDNGIYRLDTFEQYTTLHISACNEKTLYTNSKFY